MISIVVITFNRLKLLKLCVNQVLSKTSDFTTEIVIWNNASTDGTREYLAGIKDNRFKIINNDENIGVNARGKAYHYAKGEYLISLDDDVIDAPMNWDKTLLDAFRKMPEIGFLSSHIIDDKNGTHANYMYRQRDIESAEISVINGIEVLVGWSGCWCAITSRELYEKVGGFQESKKFIFWNEDQAYILELMKIGYSCCLLKSLKVFHAAGPYYLNDERIQEAKGKFYKHVYRKRKITEKKAKIKLFLEKIPLMHRLNKKFKIYELPE